MNVHSREKERRLFADADPGLLSGSDVQSQQQQIELVPADHSGETANQFTHRQSMNGRQIG